MAVLSLLDLKAKPSIHSRSQMGHRSLLNSVVIQICLDRILEPQPQLRTLLYSKTPNLEIKQA